MAQRSIGQGRGPSNGALLNDRDYGNPYHTGQPPPVDDHELLRTHDIPSDGLTPDTPNLHDYNETPYHASPTQSHHLHPTSATALRADISPAYLTSNDRSLSQTSVLNHHQRYSDFEDLPDDHELGGYYASSDIDDDNTPAAAAAGGKRSRFSTGNRNSIMAMGGGFMGRAKDMLGMGPTYSDMDLPLRQGSTAQQNSGLDSPTQTPTGPVALRQKAHRSRPFQWPWNRKIDPASLGPRIIHLGNAPANAANRYLDNHVSTAKYNFATFLPKFLFEQFSKYANLFFLFTAVLQQIPNISPTSRYTTIVPLGLVLIVSAVKEAVEDSRRKSQDRQLNISKTQVLRGSSFQEIQWLHVAVGDIVRVSSEEPFPADLVLLASSEPEGLCYIETANLDGETNLKIKHAIPETADTLVEPASLARLSGRIKSEQPNSSLYTYEATLSTRTDQGAEKEMALNPDQLLLRGATLRNTPWIHGVVVFTGHETKLMRNATATPIKKTAVERTVNFQILLLGAILVCLSVISSVGDVLVRSKVGDDLWFIDYAHANAAQQFFSDFFTYWVLYSNLVPISLFVTVEIIKYWQALLISSDLDMYYDKTNTPANCRTSSLVEELGQVEYVFSDKTGTLTCNQMDFRQCTIDGIQYADEVPEDRKASEGDDSDTGVYDLARLRRNLASHRSRDTIHHFLSLLATCHTVIPEVSEKDGSIKYQAASPDEGALVEGAVLMGYKFVARKPRAVMIEVNGQRFEYELLAVCEFNSTRKRMSAIFRCPDGRIRCYCKGADTVILERLAARTGMVEATLQHLEEYASEGLRTLCLAMREIPEAEFQEWYQIFDKAATSVSGNRSEQLDDAAALIEREFVLLGATAIEDKLQDGVPDTIHTMQAAGIKVWVLTGDRQETAINIGMSCKLISEDMTLLIVNEETAADTRTNIERKLVAVQSQAASGSSDILALIIDGKSLTYALERDLEKLFLDLAVMCKAVICCRVSPLQKALVVKLVKRHKKAILLAIGDGANDVSMIQAAHIGIGISGVEGLQAARSADVSIAQFRYLRKLLLVHGAWSYQRISKVILYFYYKNTAFYMTQFWYSFQNAFSGEVIYESWTLSFFNVLFTALPPFVLGIFDQYVSARLLDRYPQLYSMSQKGYFFKTSSFWSWVLNGFYHSLILYIFSQLFYLWDLPMSDGTTTGHWAWGISLYTAALVTCLGKAALITNAWTKYTVIAIPGSVAIWFIFLPIYATLAPRLNFSTEYWNILPVILTSPVFWLQMIILPFLCLIRDFAWKYAKRMYRPQSYHHVQEIQKFNVQDYRPRMEQFQKAIRKVRQVQRMQKQRGYAFSQTDESQTRVLQAYDTTRARGTFGEMASSRR